MIGTAQAKQHNLMANRQPAQIFSRNALGAIGTEIMVDR